MKTRQSLKVIHRQRGTRALWLLLAISLFFILPAFIWPGETWRPTQLEDPLLPSFGVRTHHSLTSMLGGLWTPGPCPSLWGHLVLIMRV